MNSAATIHKDAVIIDAVSPLIERYEYLDLYAKGGVTCVAPTVAALEGPAQALTKISAWLRLLDRRPDLVHVRTAADIERAKAAGKLGILFHFQGTGPIEQDLNLVEAYRTLGVRLIQLSYNGKNYVGDGCEERTDAGLSRFGERLIERLNENRIIVDVSHTGHRTSMEAMEVSKRPVVFSHSNAKAILDTRRNISEDQAKAVAKTGGLVGATLVPFFTVRGCRPTIDNFISHIDYFVKLIGVDHVGLGLDFTWTLPPFASDEVAGRNWQDAVNAGWWDPDNYPKPPHYYPQGMDTPAEMMNLTEALLKRGYDAEDVKKILGGNWLRVCREVWGA
ncbi:dipeptidase [Bradyrhizobium uaiense]|uniref:Membrane dipeptidase n=1 Tax=Bradyrhizobium uaiense TaxID=2594946 RepID=A0A6P1BW99_9BRAD|nr:dipeptidase [Bradyrhizobium uaiense]NEV02569.1 membrane dipeptidase [Bradyrhizobium uaiense]